jgi:hypothetical protein
MRNPRQLLLVLAVTALVLSLFIATTVVLAHNAGHIHLADGTCVDVGSGKHNTHVDLIPGPGDQYGTRYAAEQGDTPIYPRFCAEVTDHTGHRAVR